jgi:hypothetical protein
VISAGDFFLTGKSGGVIGAVVPWRGGYAGAAPAHIFQLAGTKSLRIGNLNAKVVHTPEGADLAFFPLLSACRPTVLGKPQLGEATLENKARKKACRISEVSWSVLYVVLPPGDLPGPGDSGTPLVQDGRVVGMLLSLSMHTCKGIAMSADMIENEARKFAGKRG